MRERGGGRSEGREWVRPGAEARAGRRGGGRAEAERGPGGAGSAGRRARWRARPSRVFCAEAALSCVCRLESLVGS
eukprot:7270623-Prorocentrum_lima.AAC.1